MSKSLRLAFAGFLLLGQAQCSGSQSTPSDTGNLVRAEAITKEIGDSLASCLNALAESEHLHVIDQFIEANYSQFPSRATEKTLTVGSTSFSWGSDPLVFSYISPDFELQYEESYLETNGRVGELTLLRRNEEFGEVANVVEYTAQLDCSNTLNAYQFHRSLSDQGYSYAVTSEDDSGVLRFSATRSFTQVCSGEVCEEFDSFVDGFVENVLQGVTFQKGGAFSEDLRPENTFYFRDYFVSERMNQIVEQF